MGVHGSLGRQPVVLDAHILDIIEDIYGAALEPDRWPGTLDNIAGFMDADHAHVFFADTNSGLWSVKLMPRGRPIS